MNSILELDNFSFTIDEVRRLLICRDTHKKIVAVELILRSISSSDNPHTLIKYLTKADIVELLCEASCTTDLTLLGLTFKCLLKFIKDDSFFEQNHMTFTFEYILRTLNVLLKIDEDKNIFIRGLHLVCVLINRMKKCQKIPLGDMCDISSIIHLLTQVFLNNTSNPLLLCTGAEVILNLLKSDGLEGGDTLSEVTTQALRCLMIAAKRDKSIELLIVTGELVINSMRFIMHEIQNIPLSVSKVHLIVELHLVSKEFLIPILMGEEVNLKNTELMEIILNALLSMYYSPDKNSILEFSEYIVCKGILGFLPKLEKLVSDDNLTLAIRSILYEALVCLSEAHLGAEDWNGLLARGLEGLPSQWNTVRIYLATGKDLLYPIASIVYNYFFLIYFSSPMVDIHFLRNISQYILLLPSKPSSPILKALWFNFSVAFLCFGGDVPQSKVPMVKLIQFLVSTDIQLIYTHHPAILFWTFSDPCVPQELQAQVVLSWTDQDDEQSQAELQSLLTVNQEACSLIMEVMTVCKIQTSCKIKKIIDEVLQCRKDMLKIISEHSWTLLPTILAKFSSCPESISYESVANLIRYCCDYVPGNLEQTLIMRLSCLLPGAFSRYFITSFRNPSTDMSTFTDQEKIRAIINSLNLASAVLRKGSDLGDRRVAASLTGNEEFLNIIEYFLGASDENILAAIMNLLSLFIINQNRSNYRPTKVINLEGLKILKFLQGGAELCIGSLNFLAVYLETISEKTVTPLLVQIPPPTPALLRALYLHIHMICSKTNEEAVERSCWLCLTRLLQLSSSLGLQEQLACLPFTARILLSTTPPTPYLIRFFSVWIKLLPPHSPRSLTSLKSQEVIRKFSDTIEEPQLKEEFINTLRKALLLGSPHSHQKITERNTEKN